jgi:hypothetical protein
MHTDRLPYVDEHATIIAADSDEVWGVLLETLDRALSRPGAVGYARIVGASTALSPVHGRSPKARLFLVFESS